MTNHEWNVVRSSNINTDVVQIFKWTNLKIYYAIYFYLIYHISYFICYAVSGIPMSLYLLPPKNEIIHLLFFTHPTICETMLEMQTIFMAPINYARTSCINVQILSIICSRLKSCIECVFQCARIGL